MLDRPDLANSDIIACLKSSYGLTPTAIEFLPLGYDSYAGVYRVTASGKDYFLKVKSDAVNDLSVLLPRYLNDQGIEEAVAPLPTNNHKTNHELWGTAGQFTVLLYPFIEGTSGGRVALSGDQWAAFGAVLRRIHDIELSPDLRQRLPQETFVPHPHLMAVARQFHADVITRDYENPFEQQLTAYWREHYDAIGTIIDRTDQLSRILQDASPEYVVCHADIHTGNLLVDAHGALHVVDWDQPLLAPRERDLMFVTVGGFVTEAREETAFFQGYGHTEIDVLTMAYYRYERTMEDLAAFAEQVFSTNASADTKRDSIKWFMVQFAPGSTFEAARNLDRLLPESRD